MSELSEKIRAEIEEHFSVSQKNKLMDKLMSRIEKHLPQDTPERIIKRKCKCGCGQQME